MIFIPWLLFILLTSLQIWHGFLCNCCLQLVRAYDRNPRESASYFHKVLFLSAVSFISFFLSFIIQGDGPTALRILTDAITGNRMAPQGDTECELCCARNPKKCTGCYRVFYCSQVCQKLHRPTHKLVCKKAD